MKKLLLTTAIVMSFGTTAAFAHHPAVDMVDEDTYEMIDTNLIGTPHYDMEFDDEMGGTTEVGGAAESRDADVGNTGDAMGGDIADVGAEMGGEDMADVGAAMEDREEMNSMAGEEPSGPMGATSQK